jgi:hypothetical protein
MLRSANSYRKLVALILTLAVTPACSFTFSGGPPANAASMPYFDCTSDYAAPVGDTMFAAASLATLIPQNGQNPRGQGIGDIQLCLGIQREEIWRS